MARSARQTSASNVVGLSGLLQAVLAQAGSIQAADSSIDSKANNLMAASLVIVALLAAFLRNGDGRFAWLAVASMLLMVLVVATVIYATRNRSYRGAVVDVSSHGEYMAKDDLLLLAQLIEDAGAANTQNIRILQDKHLLFRQALVVFAVGFALGVLSLFVG